MVNLKNMAFAIFWYSLLLFAITKISNKQGRAINAALSILYYELLTNVYSFLICLISCYSVDEK